MTIGDKVAWPRSTISRVLPFVSWLPEVDPRSFRSDLIAALTTTVLVLPQSVAYALIAGLPAEYGLYASIITPIVAALFGSSRHLISGPVAAVSIVVFSVASGLAAPGGAHYITVVLTLTFMAGLFQLLLGLLRMGMLVNFISHTVIVAFTAGAAVLIAVSQLDSFFGLSKQAGDSVFHTLVGFAGRVDESNLYVLAVGAVTLLGALVIRFLRPRWPHMFMAMIVGSAFCLLINGAGHGVPMVGAMAGHLPPLSVPELSLRSFRHLSTGAFAIAIIALVEAVSIARSVGTRAHQRIDGNQEFIGQGLSNVVGSFFSCYMGSGSFTRTGINFDSGAKTPIASLLTAAFVCMVLVLVPGATAYLPFPAMAGIVLLVAWNLIDFRSLGRIVRASRRETVILVATFCAALFLTLETAIYVGVMLSLAFYLWRTAHPRLTPVAPVMDQPGHPLRNAAKWNLTEYSDLKIVRVDGSLFFGVVDYVGSYLQTLTDTGYRHILLVGSGINFIDVPGAEMLAQEAQRLRSLDGRLYLCQFKDAALKILRRKIYMDDIGQDNVFTLPGAAIDSAFACMAGNRDAAPERIPGRVGQ